MIDLKDKKNIDTTPFVSISCITFNHKDYIRQAIDGFLMQKTNFTFEVLIHDDASTDGTEEIIREYEAKYPEIIKPLYEKENQWTKGRIGSAVFNFPRAQGKYIALCEGDDYWTDPLKLQKQVDFLEGNPDYALCFHPVKIWDEEKQKLIDDYLTREVPETTDIYELAKGNYIHTPSVVFRSKTIKNLPDELFKSPVGDYFLHMLSAEYGKIKKLPNTMAVYRVSNSGVWSLQTADYRVAKWLKLLMLLKQYFIRTGKLEYSELVEHNITQRKRALLNYYFRIKKSKEEIFSSFNQIENDLHWNWTLNDDFYWQQKKEWNKKNFFPARVLRYIKRKINGNK